MRKLAFIILLLSVISLGAAEITSGQPGESPLHLKDGSYLFISGDNTMRMVDKDGKPIKMKNKKVWHHIDEDMKK